MRRAFLLALVTSAALTFGTSSAGATYAPKNCLHPAVEPVRIVLSCGDFGAFLKSLNWAFWRDDRAKSGGQLSLNDCDPSCAEGHFHDYHAVVRLKEPRRKKCDGDRVRLFTRADLRFPDKSPPHAHAWRHNELYCAP